MKIVGAELRRIHLPLREPFKIAYNTWTSMPSLILRLETDTALVGWGESVPDEGVTGETIEGVYATLAERLLPELIGQDALAIEEFHERAGKVINGGYAAKAAIDIALFDLKGQSCNQPLYQLLGGDTNVVTAPAVLGMSAPESLKERLLEYLAAGYTHYKLKLGGSYGEDCRRVAMAREILGEGATIKVDANQGWDTWDKALQVIKGIEPYNIELVEQPVRHWDFAGLQRVRQNSPIPIMVDEGVCDARDLLRLILAGGIDWVNIKLMKCGGILPATKMAALAEAAGIKVQVGSMLESSIGSLAGAHLHRAYSCIKSSEMVGPRWFSQDIGDFRYQGCRVVFSDRPGLGVKIDEDMLKRLTVSGVRIEQSGARPLP